MFGLTDATSVGGGTVTHLVAAMQTVCTILVLTYILPSLVVVGILEHLASGPPVVRPFAERAVLRRSVGRSSCFFVVVVVVLLLVVFGRLLLRRS